jgi:outer membrane protein OmpA-like peptidoglycan-associated protein
MYPDIKIDVRSHTDSRGNDNYNMKLSDRRAKATMKWMIDNGISKDRITGKGYGESQLVNKCANGVPCTPQEHQANRRSEFIVVEM